MSENGNKTEQKGEFPNPNTQFKPGNPGGPGRPRTKPITEALKRISSEKVKIKIDGVEHEISTADALAQVAINRALGKNKDALAWWNAVREMLDGKTPDTLNINQYPGLDDDDLEAIARHKGGPE